MCKKCGDRGFTEENHGLIRIFCDCVKGKELRAEVIGEIPESSGVVLGMFGPGEHVIPLKALSDSSSGTKPDDEPKALILSERMCRDGETLGELEAKARKLIKASTGEPDDSNSRTKPDNQPTGSPGTGKPKQLKKQKATRKARARAG